MSDEDIKRRQRFKHIWLPAWMVDPRRKCTHSEQYAIYGDEINAAGGKRARCLICSRLMPNLPTK